MLAGPFLLLHFHSIFNSIPIQGGLVSLCCTQEWGRKGLLSMKKTLLSTIIAAALITCLLVGCSAQASKTSLLETPKVNTADTSPMGNEYEAVLALKTANYGELSVGEFNATVEAAINNDAGFLSIYSNALDAVSPEDENYSFIYHTLRYSVGEVVLPQLGEPVSFPQSAMKEDVHTQADDVGEDFIFTVMYSIEYDILDHDGLTVLERDQVLESIQRKVQDLISGMSNEELQAANIREHLQASFNNLARDTSTESLALRSVEIRAIELHVGGQESTL